MDESLILERLDRLSEEIQSLKSGMLGELKSDLQPVLEQASPRVMSFLADLEGEYRNEDMGHLVKNILVNIQSLNAMLDMLKSGMELKDDMGPVVKQALPRITEFMAELDGEFDKEELAALLRKTLSNLANFNSALDMMSAGMELKNDLGPVVKQALPKVSGFMAELDGEFDSAELTSLLRKTLSNLANFNSALDMMSAGMELKNDLGPVVKQALPKVTEFMAELDGEFDSAELTSLLRKTLSNLANFNSALDMMSAGMELKNDLGPVVKQALPKITEFMAELDGEFDSAELTSLLRKTLSNLANFNSALDMMNAGMELKNDLGPVIKQLLPKITEFMADLDGEVEIAELGGLVKNFLINIQTFNRMLAMVKPGAELVDEFGNIFKQYDVLSRISKTLNDFEQRGLFRLAARILGSVEGFRCSEGQMESMCAVVRDLDLTTPSYVGPMEVMNEIRDPNVQETLGAAFKIMRAVGCCLRANRLRQVAEDYPEEFPGVSTSSETCV